MFTRSRVGWLLLLSMSTVAATGAQTTGGSISGAVYVREQTSERAPKTLLLELHAEGYLLQRFSVRLPRKVARAATVEFLTEGWQSKQGVFTGPGVEEVFVRWSVPGNAKIPQVVRV